MHAIHKTCLTTFGALLLLASGAAQAHTSPAASTAMPASPAVSASPTAAPAPAATAKVGQAQFTTAVSQRKPADDIRSLDNRHNKVFFFSVLKHAAGQTITHRWEFNGKTMADVKFEPKADHWRVWSSKTLMPDQTGTWTVEVVDGSGNLLMSKSFDYTQAKTVHTPPAHKPLGRHKVQPQAIHKAPTPTTAASTAATPPLN